MTRSSRANSSNAMLFHPNAMQSRHPSSPQRHQSKPQRSLLSPGPCPCHSRCLQHQRQARSRRPALHRRPWRSPLQCQGCRVQPWKQVSRRRGEVGAEGERSRAHVSVRAKERGRRRACLRGAVIGASCFHGRSIASASASASALHRHFFRALFAASDVSCKTRQQSAPKRFLQQAARAC
jgi:hypothetical protein